MNEKQLLRKYADMLKEDAQTCADNKEQARAIIYLCKRYIEACSSENKKLMYRIAEEMLELVQELAYDEENP